jgi:predicted DNA-binding transcriptional regulator AlpA
MDKIIVGNKKYVSIDDYAKLKDISRKTVYNKINDGKVKTKKILNRQFIEL